MFIISLSFVRAKPCISNVYKIAFPHYYEVNIWPQKVRKLVSVYVEIISLHQTRNLYSPNHNC